MTLDEAIKHAEEVAEEKYELSNAYMVEEEKCIKCADENMQLVGWLRDYKRLLEQTQLEDGDRAVSLNTVLSEIGRWTGYLDEDMILRIQTGIKKLPSVTPSNDCDSECIYCKHCFEGSEFENATSEPKTGHWILLDECSNSGYYCSECHKKVVKEGWSNTVKKIKYCPNCGAKMEVEKNG